MRKKKPEQTWDIIEIEERKNKGHDFIKRPNKLERKQNAKRK